MEFIRFATFEKSASGILTETDIFELEMSLAEHPDAGDLIPQGGGFANYVVPPKGMASAAGLASSTTTSCQRASSC